MKDYIVSLGSLALAAFVYLGSRGFADSGAGLDQDPAYYPSVLALLLAVMAAALLISTLMKRQKFSLSWNLPSFLRVVLVFAVLILYVLAIKCVGFLLASLIFVPGCILLFGGGAKLALLGGLPLAVGIYFAFTILLKVPLPQGILFG